MGGLWGATSGLLSSPEDLDENEEVKDDRESIAAKLSELKLEMAGSNISSDHVKYIRIPSSW